MNPLSNRAEISCTGKGAYTPTQARRIATEMRRRGRKKMDPYHCIHCNAWHVGSSTPMPDKRREAKQGKRKQEDLE